MTKFTDDRRSELIQVLQEDHAELAATVKQGARRLKEIEKLLKTLVPEEYNSTTTPATIGRKTRGRSREGQRVAVEEYLRNQPDMSASVREIVDALGFPYPSVSSVISKMKYRDGAVRQITKGRYQLVEDED